MLFSKPIDFAGGHVMFWMLLPSSSNTTRWPEVHILFADPSGFATGAAWKVMDRSVPSVVIGSLLLPQVLDGLSRR